MLGDALELGAPEMEPPDAILRGRAVADQIVEHPARHEAGAAILAELDQDANIEISMRDLRRFKG